MKHSISLLLLSSSVALAEEFTLYSQPITLRQGQVHNAVQQPIPIPGDVRAQFEDEDTQMAITGFDLDLVYLEQGANGENVETKVPLYHGYNHHYILYVGDEDTMEQIYESGKRKDPFSTEPDSCVQKKIDVNGNDMDVNNFRHCFSSMLPSECSREMFKSFHKKKPHKRIAMFGGAAGSEYRHNPHNFPSPYGMIVDSPEAFAPLIHVINTRNTTSHDSHAFASPVSPMYECPCTPQRVFDLKNHTIDGCHPSPPFWCNPSLEDNDGCSLATYDGGYRCCEHANYLFDTEGVDVTKLPVTTFYMRFTFNYRVVRTGDNVKPLKQAGCCDVTGDWQHKGIANIEYTIPQCAPGTPPGECVHVAESVQYAEFFEQDADIELVYAAAHLHKGSISLDLYNNATGELLCHAEPMYGHSAEAGDENEYLVGILPCKWETPIRMRKSTMLRTVAKYNATERLTGVMSLWLMSYADVEQTTTHHEVELSVES